MKVTFLFSAVAALTASTLFSTDIPALEKTAAKGDPTAQFELARACLKGDGIKKDPARAFDLMTGAANQGHAEAMGGVGFFYASGIVVPKDEAKAIEWFRKGAENGGPKSQLNLGKLLAEGKGTEKNEEEGRKWIKASADQGLPEALFAEGSICYFGRYGQAVDYAQAYPYLLKAAGSGHPEAQNLVGIMFETGQGVDTDDVQAEVWYRKAAEQGQVKAQASLGRVLGPESRDQAKRLEALAWLLVASNKGEITAIKLLEEVKSGTNPADFAQAEKLSGQLEKSLRTGISK